MVLDGMGFILLHFISLIFFLQNQPIEYGYLLLFFKIRYIIFPIPIMKGNFVA